MFSKLIGFLSAVLLLWLMDAFCDDIRPPRGPGGPSNNLGPPASPDSANRYTTPSRKKRRRPTPMRISFEEDCDYLAYYCLRAYKTGAVCGRTLYYRYQNFDNYCMLDYVNCMERYEDYSHIDDHLLEQYYVQDN